MKNRQSSTAFIVFDLEEKKIWLHFPDILQWRRVHSFNCIWKSFPPPLQEMSHLPFAHFLFINFHFFVIYRKVINILFHIKTFSKSFYFSHSLI